MRQRLLRAPFIALALGVALAACTSGSQSARSAGGAAGRPGPAERWNRFMHLPGVVDLAGPRADGSFVVAAAGRLFTLSRAGSLAPFARGPGGYVTAIGPEPYIALVGSGQAGGTGCSFRAGTVFALQPVQPLGVIMISTTGRARRFASLPAGAMPTGIAFDSTGRFGHDLLVTDRSPAGMTAVLAIDCAGRVHAIMSNAPALEGGIAVAPASFGRYGGDLIAPNEKTGRVYAIRPDGTVLTLALSGLPYGGDIGVESAGFVPAGFGASGAAYLADRLSPGNRHPGTNSVLRLTGSELAKAGVRAGDLLVATEASARTIVVRCASSCQVRYIAFGPAIAHAEGHIAFALVSVP